MTKTADGYVQAEELEMLEAVYGDEARIRRDGPHPRLSVVIYAGEQAPDAEGKIHRVDPKFAS